MTPLKRPWPAWLSEPGLIQHRNNAMLQRMFLPQPSRGAVIRICIVRLILVTAVFAVNVRAVPPPSPLPNADFVQGDDTGRPLAWHLAGGEGRWVDRTWLEVTGTGNDQSVWAVFDHPVVPGERYHFAMRARRLEGAGTVVSGPAFANRDHLAVGSRWEWHGHSFRVPDDVTRGMVRVGQWHATGRIQFDAVRLIPVLPVHSEFSGLVLGEDESIRQGQYRFDGSFAHAGSNDHRPLVRATAGFNTDRWVFSEGAEVIYRFVAPAGRFTGGAIEANVNYHVRGSCRIEIRHGTDQWQSLGEIHEAGSIRAVVPDDRLPAKTIELRLIATGGGAVLQVNRLLFHADLDVAVPDAVGNTVYVRVTEPVEGVSLERMLLREGVEPIGQRLAVTVRNRGPAAHQITARLTPVAFEAAHAGGPVAVEAGAAAVVGTIGLAPGEEQTMEVPLDVTEPGEHCYALTIHRDASPAFPLTALVPVHRPEFKRTDYGYLLGNGSGSVALWWCEAGWKVPRRRALPQERDSVVRLSAARRDREGVQVVVRPAEPIDNLRATMSPLEGPGGALIPPENVRVLRVHYHFVHSPTDHTGMRAWWPDALPPLDQPMHLVAGQNQPLWLSVDVPAEAVPGLYRGILSLEADGFASGIPVELRVWDFTLPERNHIETAFGFSPGEVYRYHQLETEADRRKVLDLYFEAFARNRISPYNPTPLDPFHVRFQPNARPPRADVDFSAFDPALRRAISRYGFTGLRLPIPGMGGGTFHSRYEPRIGAYNEETDEYQAMFASLVEQLESHLAANDWLDLAYVYWFDEPAPRDYPFVIAGMERLRRYAPRLRRMLTEAPVEPLFGHVDIWCPVSHHYDPAAAAARRKQGERFWWYVCTVPKAPYAGLFIDHPATALRVWLWQTWQRGIDGILIWQSNYWTSDAAYPETPQNPYEDPMGYVSGYSTPTGTRLHWGNGDGRFLYPPLAAAVPGAAGPGPVIEPPVSSIRWEMLREGIEDWEMLNLLRSLLARHGDRLTPAERDRTQALLEVPPSITSDMTTFTTDPRPIHQHRARVAQAIERLQKHAGPVHPSGP